ncbi:MAG TPA: glycosyltransferase [Thermoanaerobaculia bacterium]|nr:glycosyltransferase [Thermoanaerobaculia bacterium]
MLPTVSVVVPVRNGAAYLADALESVLDQSFVCFELIVVDDGSTDDSAEIAEAFARRDPRVVVLRREHSGLVRSLNDGIAGARGTYIARMDADDLCHPGRLEKQIAYLDAHPECVAVGCAVEVIDARDHHVGVIRFAETHEAIVDALLRGSTPMAHPATVFRRQAFDAAGGYDASSYPSEDLALWIAMSETGRLANLPEPLLRYRRHGGSVSVRQREAQMRMTAAIADRARRARGLPPLRRRYLTPGRAVESRYHFECARFALVGGPRVAVLHHAAKAIASDPLWLEPYAALIAALFPRAALRWFLERRARFRTQGTPRGAARDAVERSAGLNAETPPL